MKMILYINCFLFIIIGNSIIAQSSLTGHSGLLMIPTAEIIENGTIAFGIGHLPKKYAIMHPGKVWENSYYATIGFLPFLELTYAFTVPNLNVRERGYGDRKIIIRGQILKEKKYFPSIVLGLHDPNIFKDVGRSNLFTATYFVVSKNIKLSKKLKLGLHSGYGVDWFESSRKKQLLGLFGGSSLQYQNSVALLLEYDSNKFNPGIRITILDKLQLTLALLDLKTITGGVSYIFQL